MRGRGPAAGHRSAAPARRRPGRGTRAAVAGQGGGLPDRIAGYSPLTGSVSAAPPGRALLLYGYGNSEMFRTYQTLVLGADAEVYRQLDAAPERTKPWLLSPDGRTVVLSEPDREVAEVRVVDLETGLTRQVPVPRPGGVVPLALSPDGNTLAYSIVDMTPIAAEAARDAGRYVEWYATGHGELMLLDLRTGQATGTGIVPVSAAAFAPDGRRLVVQSELRTWLVGLDGQRQRR
ncbi:TolB family protein [Catellatospora coxensis]